MSELMIEVAIKLAKSFTDVCINTIVACGVLGACEYNDD